MPAHPQNIKGQDSDVVRMMPAIGKKTLDLWMFCSFISFHLIQSSIDQFEINCHYNYETSVLVL